MSVADALRSFEVVCVSWYELDNSEGRCKRMRERGIEVLQRSDYISP